jgi:HTH-type transcriptional regulator/antitoxin HigA
MSPTTIELHQQTYGQLLRRTLPRVIRTDAECERFTNELTSLDEREDLSPEEMELAELLTVLIDEYEERRYPIHKATPQQTLQHLINGGAAPDAKRPVENLRLKRNHFRGFSRQRSISKAQAKKTGRFFPCRGRIIYLISGESAARQNRTG